MTIEEAIRWYEAKLLVNERFGLLGAQNDAAHLALAALRAQAEAEKNKPLTPEEIEECETVKHGRWLDAGKGFVICSECGEEHCWDEYRATYCEDCGAKMDAKEDVQSDQG